MNKIDKKPEELSVGVVGLGMMGCSISTCLLMAGHKVISVAPIPDDMKHAEKRITEHLKRSKEEGLINKEPGEYLQHLIVTEDYGKLAEAALVVECTIENLDIKKSVYNKIEKVISKDALMTSNTSAIPISVLQQQTTHPHRFFGLHWTEPSH